MRSGLRSVGFGFGPPAGHHPLANQVGYGPHSAVSLAALRCDRIKQTACTNPSPTMTEANVVLGAGSRLTEVLASRRDLVPGQLPL